MNLDSPGLSVLQWPGILLLLLLLVVQGGMARCAGSALRRVNLEEEGEKDISSS